MFGQPIDNKGVGPTSYAFVLPCSDESRSGNATRALENPADHCITVTYMQFYPYNFGKSPVAGQGRFGDHIGDIEYVAVVFIKGQPDLVAFAAHAENDVYKV